MADSRYQPNPLRPYYVPATIGRETTPIPLSTTINASTSAPSFSFPDLDYSDYIPEGSPSALGNLRGLLDQALWRYVNTVLAQPFEVAKLILQARVAQEEDVDDAFRGPEVTENNKSARESNTSPLHAAHSAPHRPSNTAISTNPGPARNYTSPSSTKTASAMPLKSALAITC